MIQIVAKKIGGSLSYNASSLREYLSKHRDNDEFLIVVEKLSAVKSKESLGYYFRAIVDNTRKNEEQFGGWSKPAMHKWLKKECAYDIDVSDMDRREFAEYIDRCIHRLAEEGISVPTPEQYFKKLKGE